MVSEVHFTIIGHCVDTDLLGYGFRFASFLIGHDLFGTSLISIRKGIQFSLMRSQNRFHILLRNALSIAILTGAVHSNEVIGIENDVRSIRVINFFFITVGCRKVCIDPGQHIR